MSRQKTISALEPIADKEDFNKCYYEFKNHIKRNPELISKLKDILKPLQGGFYYPFVLFQAFHDVLPKMFGENGTRYIFHVLRNGIVDENMNDNGSEIDSDIYIELSSLIYNYGIQFMCAEKFVDNPLDFVTLQSAYTFNSTKNFFRIIRADQKYFELELDVNTIIKIARVFVEKANHIIKQKQITLDEDERVRFLGTVHEFMVLNGLIPDGDIENEEDNGSGNEENE